MSNDVSRNFEEFNPCQRRCGVPLQEYPLKFKQHVDLGPRRSGCAGPAATMEMTLVPGVEAPLRAYLIWQPCDYWCQPRC
eukprot:2085961-Amphidinium_carterae.1